jgi:beta-galactosidase
MVPPLYSASDEVLQQLADYVNRGGRVVMAFKSGFTDQYSTVRHVMAPGPLRAATGFHYQEFTNLAEPQQLAPDPYGVGDQNKGAVWQEFLVPDTAQAITSFTDPYWHFPAITRNQYGSGTLIYEATHLTDALQREVVRDVVKSAGLTGPDQTLPPPVKVRHGQNGQDRMLHYYLNFSGEQQSFSYPYGSGEDLLTSHRVNSRSTITLKPWDLAIIAEQ